MSRLISKKDAIDILRRIASNGLGIDDPKQLRILATQLEKEMNEHNRIAKRSRDRLKEYLDKEISNG